MNIDIAVIDKRDINKKEQFHLIDETARKYYKIVFFQMMERAVEMS